jgi:manganese oxidase
VLNDGVNLQQPSGLLLDFGNLDFDVNLIVTDAAFDPTGQYFFDIFDTDGFLGDVPLGNMAYAPFMEVLPRKYRFRILSAGMSRFHQLQIADPNGRAVPPDRQ